MLCRRCKREIPDDAIFCCYCAAKQIIVRQKQNKKSRGNGTGSIYRLPNKKWVVAVVDHYYISKTGKLTAQRKKKTFDRKSDAINYATTLKSQRPRKHIMNLNELNQIFVSSKKYEKLSASQKNKLGFAWERLRGLWLIKIPDLTLQLMQSTINSQKMKDGSQITYYPARDMKVMLSHLYNVAIENEQETINKAKYIELPDAPKAKRQVFSEEDIAKLWDDYYGQCAAGHAEAHEFTGYILTLIYTGMRVGELYGLSMDSFRISQHHIIGGEKTEAGRDREIPIGKSIFPVIKKFYDSGVFPLKNIWKFYDDYNDTLKRLGIKPYPAQTCRHTYFTLMVERKVHPAIIASMGGHAQYETAIDNYNRLPLKSKIEAANKL